MKKPLNQEDIITWLIKNNQGDHHYDLIELNDRYINLFEDDENYQLFLKQAVSNGHQYMINIDGNFVIKDTKLKKLPIQLGVVDTFDCSENQLTTLMGAPYCTNKNFFCSDNQLKSLEYASRIILGDLYCMNNKLEELENIYLIKGSLLCYGNNIKNLIKFPSWIEKDVIMSGLSYIAGESLIKYKPESESVLEFFQHRDFSFWSHLHQIDKIHDEQEKILSMMMMNEKIKKKKKL